jgi:hypothetical protein
MGGLLVKWLPDKWKVRWRAFRLWQRRPPVVAPMSAEEHACASCGTRFQGNYCPRCGQSPQIGRFSFHTAFRLFVDVWGLGNRGMFRSLRDLMLRPGYMIRDYLGGMQSAYFPPFKMFFLLTTFSLLVTHVFQPEDIEAPALNWDTETTESTAAAADTTVAVAAEAFPDTLNVKETVKEAEQDSIPGIDKEELTQRQQRLDRVFNQVWEFKNGYPSIFSFLLLLLFAVLLYFFFRHTPAIPDLRFAELVVAFTYVANMASIYSIVGTPLGLTNLTDIASLVAVFIAMHQFTGFRYLRLIAMALLGILMMGIVLIGVIVVTVIL